MWSLVIFHVLWKGRRYLFQIQVQLTCPDVDEAADKLTKEGLIVLEREETDIIYSL